MSNTANIQFTEDEKRLLLKIFRVNLPKDATREKIDETFNRLLTKLQKLQESDKRSPKGVDFSELATITLEQKQDAPFPFQTILPKDSKEFIQALKKMLNEIPWTAIAFETAKCVVVGSSPQSLAIAVGVELLMRVRFGNLFRGGAAAIQMVLNNLNKMGLELAEDTAKDVANAMMTVMKAYTKTPEDIILRIEGASTKFFSAFSKELANLAKKVGFQIEIPTSLLHQKKEEKENTAPTPFHTRPDLTKVGV